MIEPTVDLAFESAVARHGTEQPQNYVMRHLKLSDPLLDIDRKANLDGLAIGQKIDEAETCPVDLDITCVWQAGHGFMTP